MSSDDKTDPSVNTAIDKIVEGLYYLDPGICDGKKVIKSQQITREILQEYYYNFMFSHINCVKDIGLEPSLFEEKFLLKDGQLDDLEKVFLYNFIQKIKPKKIIEFSPSNGHSTVIISKALEDLDIVPDYFETHEIDEDCFHNTNYLLHDWDIDFVENKLGNVFETLDRDKLSDVDFMFIDSDHGGEFAEKYIKEFFPLLKKGCWVVIHDVRFHKLYVNDESLVVRDFVENSNNVDTYFHITDVMKMFGIANDFKPCAKNTMFFLRIK